MRKNYSPDISIAANMIPFPGFLTSTTASFCMTRLCSCILMPLTGPETTLATEDTRRTVSILAGTCFPSSTESRSFSRSPLVLSYTWFSCGVVSDACKSTLLSTSITMSLSSQMSSYSANHTSKRMTKRARKTTKRKQSDIKLYRCHTWIVQSYLPGGANVHPLLICSLDPHESATKMASRLFWQKHFAKTSLVCPLPNTVKLHYKDFWGLPKDICHISVFSKLSQVHVHIRHAAVIIWSNFTCKQISEFSETILALKNLHSAPNTVHTLPTTNYGANVNCIKLPGEGILA